MNPHPNRYLNGQRTVVIDNRYEKAYDGLVALLAMIAARTPTGDAYLRLKLNNGGIQGVKISIEGDPLRDRDDAAA